MTGYFAQSVAGKTAKISIEYEGHEMVLSNYDTIVGNSGFPHVRAGGQGEAMDA